MKYFVGYLIQGIAAEYYAAITQELSARFGIQNLAAKLPPHITFKAPFEADDITPFKEKLAAICEREAAMKLTLHGFGRFDALGRVIFLEVENDSELMRVAEEIASELESFGGDKKQLPRPLRLHASVARFLTPGQSEEIWNYLHARPLLHFDMQFDNLTLFSKAEGPWQVDTIFPFGSSIIR